MFQADPFYKMDAVKTEIYYSSCKRFILLNNTISREIQIYTYVYLYMYIFAPSWLCFASVWLFNVLLFRQCLMLQKLSWNLLHIWRISLTPSLPVSITQVLWLQVWSNCHTNFNVFLSINRTVDDFWFINSQMFLSLVLIHTQRDGCHIWEMYGIMCFYIWNTI